MNNFKLKYLLSIEFLEAMKIHHFRRESFSFTLPLALMNSFVILVATKKSRF